MAKAVLQTKNLTKRFNGLTAVDGLTLAVQGGEVFGLLGPNGAGKTTSINMMCGLLAPDSGETYIHGVPVRGGDAEVRARVGVCPQQAILWEKLTCLEQLEFIGEMYGLNRRAARRRGDELLEVLGLASQRDKLAGVLSGGMGRRLNLALALVHDPEILVLDEPEAGLDPHSRVLVRDYIRSLARQKTIILTTHNMDEADRMADRVAIIDHGKLLVLDTPAALKATIGEGDVLELEVSGIPAQHAFTAVQAQFPGLGTALQPGIRPGEGSAGPPAPQPAPTQGGPGAGSPQPVRGQVVNFRGKDIITKLPAILAAIQDAGGEVADVRLRANTLEDVFITLTGRSLRQ